MLSFDILYVKFLWARFLKYMIIRYIYDTARNSVGPWNLGRDICSSILFFLNLYFPFFLWVRQRWKMVEGFSKDWVLVVVQLA